MFPQADLARGPDHLAKHRLEHDDGLFRELARRLGVAASKPLLDGFYGIRRPRDRK